MNTKNSVLLNSYMTTIDRTMRETETQLVSIMTNLISVNYDLAPKSKSSETKQQNHKMCT